MDWTPPKIACLSYWQPLTLRHISSRTVRSARWDRYTTAKRSLKLGVGSTAHTHTYMLTSSSLPCPTVWGPSAHQLFTCSQHLLVQAADDGHCDWDLLQEANQAQVGWFSQLDPLFVALWDSLAFQHFVHDLLSSMENQCAVWIYRDKIYKHMWKQW